MRRAITPALLFMMMCNTAFSANHLNLAKLQTNVLRPITALVFSGSDNSITLKEINRYTDSNQTLHIRMQQYYKQYSVLNAQAVIHLPFAKANHKLLPAILQTIPNETSMNGHLYQNIDADLAKIPRSALTLKQASQAIDFATNHFKSSKAHPNNIKIANPLSKRVIWIDDNHNAHWAYEVTFYSPPSALGQLPARPTYIIDADHLSIYKYWDNIKTNKQHDFVKGGGFGGNLNVGKLSYDGLAGHLSSFMVKRVNDTCYLETPEIIVKHAVTEKIMQYSCFNTNTEHNQLYWSADFDFVNDSFSPANDAMFSAQVIKAFYQSWYNVPALLNADGSEMVLTMNVHIPKMDNAYWDGTSMSFGDGDQLYPLTSLGIAAHEVSHGFTQQHSDLMYEGQSGGMNEAFSDMAAQVAEFYAYNNNTWQLGNDVFKLKGEALRYMDQPSKDCYGKSPGTFCSIDNANQYYAGLDVHFSSGVYNRAFYLLSTMPDWNPKKAFAVMLQANASYWINTTNFAEGAACAIRAADDLHYDKSAVEKAFKTVGVSIVDKCTNHD